MTCQFWIARIRTKRWKEQWDSLDTDIYSLGECTVSLVSGEFGLVVFKSRFVDEQGGVFTSSDQRLTWLCVAGITWKISHNLSLA